MKNVIPYAASITALLTAAACLSARSATVLPSGTYAYEVRDGQAVKPPGTITITISRDAAGIAVRDDANLDGTPTSAIRRLDPASFSVISFQVVGETDPAITISSDGARFRGRDGKIATLAPRVLNVPSIASDFSPSAFALVPAILHASGRTKINQYGYAFMTGEPTAGYIKAVPSSAQRPQGAAASDVSIGIQDDNGGVMTLWYDPVTFVVSVVEAGTLTIRLKPDGTAGKIQR
jgi:hypothetical protein